jgi:hypothetical protein
MAGRVSVTIDRVKFNAFEAEFAMSTNKDAAGMPLLRTLNVVVHVKVDLNDDKNIPYQTIEKLFRLGHIPDRTKLSEMKIDFWKDDSMRDVICSYKFKGWISRFKISNQADNLNAYNHVLELELTPNINNENYQEVTIGN